jgi:hypothetical protein
MTTLLRPGLCDRGQKPIPRNSDNQRYLPEIG